MSLGKHISLMRCLHKGLLFLSANGDTVEYMLLHAQLYFSEMLLNVLMFSWMGSAQMW